MLFKVLTTQPTILTFICCALVTPCALGQAMYSVTDLAPLVAPLITSSTPDGLIGINNNGQVAAYAIKAGYAHAFLYSEGTMSDLGSPYTNKSTFAYAINNTGEIAGQIGGVGGAHAVLFSGGTLTDLGVLPGGGAYSKAYAISDNGQLAGYTATLEHNYKHGFLYSGGTLTDLGTLPGGNSSYACGVNNSGQVVGYSETAD